MTDALVVRSARPDEADRLIEFWLIAGENADRPQDSAPFVTQLIERSADAVLVATIDDQVVGTVIAGWDGWRAHLYRLAVHPDHRRRGIGRLLLARAEDRLAALGAMRFDAMVLDGNDTGSSLWAGAGYAPQRQWRRWVKSAGPRDL